MASISIHALREEGDLWEHFVNLMGQNDISIHALREEGDLISLGELVNMQRFLSTPSARRATSQATSARPDKIHFYPRPPRGGRPALDMTHPAQVHISIHALREEGDGLVVQLSRVGTGISIHALREEGD